MATSSAPSLASKSNGYWGANHPTIHDASEAWKEAALARIDAEIRLAIHRIDSLTIEATLTDAKYVARANEATARSKFSVAVSTSVDNARLKIARIAEINRSSN